MTALVELRGVVALAVLVLVGQVGAPDYREVGGLSGLAVQKVYRVEVGAMEISDDSRTLGVAGLISSKVTLLADTIRCVKVVKF